MNFIYIVLSCSRKKARKYLLLRLVNVRTERKDALEAHNVIFITNIFAIFIIIIIIIKDFRI